MKEDGQTPLETLLCGRCAAAYDPEDSFCRHCGLPLHDESQLPSVRDHPHLPAVRQPSLPAGVAKGAAVVAAGTIAEVLVRRLVRSVLRRKPRASRPPARRAKGEVVPREEPMPEDAHLVSETLLVRRVRIRR